MYYTLPGTSKTLKLQSGEFWTLSCSTKLIGEVSDVGIVMDAKNDDKNNTDSSDAREIDFYLDIMCCNPDAKDCQKCESTDLDSIPIMKIGPKSDANAS